MTNQSFQQQVDELKQQWATDPRWSGVQRDYTAEDVVRLRGSFTPECTIARRGAERLWDLLHREDYVHALGAMTGGQAVQMVKAGLPAIYLSGWQVAGDANLAEQVYTQLKAQLHDFALVPGDRFSEAELGASA